MFTLNKIIIDQFTLIEQSLYVAVVVTIIIASYFVFTYACMYLHYHYILCERDQKKCSVFFMKLQMCGYLTFQR